MSKRIVTRFALECIQVLLMSSCIAVWLPVMFDLISDAQLLGVLGVCLGGTAVLEVLK